MNGTILTAVLLLTATPAVLAQVKDWTGRYLAGEDLARVNLDGVILVDADLSKANLSGATLSAANLQKAALESADLTRANLESADLTTANLSQSRATGADFQRAVLQRALLLDADLRRANFKDADLAQANLAGANLGSADLTGADLRGANLAGANLSNADLRGAKLENTSLAGANLRGALLPDGSMDPDPPRLPRADAETICGGSRALWEGIGANTDDKYWHFPQTGFENPPGVTNKERFLGTCGCSPEFLAEMYKTPAGVPFGLAYAKKWLRDHCSSSGDKTFGIQFRSRSTVR